MHTNLAKVTIADKPRRSGTKHHAPLFAQPLNASGQSSSRVQGPSGSRVSINSKARSLKSLDRSGQGIFAHGYRHNCEDVVKVRENTGKGSKGSQPTVDAVKASCQPDGKQGRWQV